MKIGDKVYFVQLIDGRASILAGLVEKLSPGRPGDGLDKQQAAHGPVEGSPSDLEPPKDG